MPECQGSSVSATSTANRPVAVANRPIAVLSLSRCRFIDFAAAWMAIVVRDSVTLAILIAWVSHDNHGGVHLNDAYAGTPEYWRRSQKPGDSYQMFPPPMERLARETR